MRKAGDVCFAQVFRDGDGMSCLLQLTKYIPGIIYWRFDNLIDAVSVFYFIIIFWIKGQIRGKHVSFSYNKISMHQIWGIKFENFEIKADELISGGGKTWHALLLDPYLTGLTWLEPDLENIWTGCSS